MPHHFSHRLNGSAVIAYDPTGHDCINDRAAHQLARRNEGLIAFRRPVSGSFSP
jgi:hypothetical protein